MLVAGLSLLLLLLLQPIPVAIGARRDSDSRAAPEVLFVTEAILVQGEKVTPVPTHADGMFCPE